LLAWAPRWHAAWGRSPPRAVTGYIPQSSQSWGDTTMRYCVGIDLGAVSCTAAVRHGHDITPGVLGEAGEAAMPAVALPRADGSVLTGEEADRRSPYEPGLVARMVTARLADPEPIVVDGWPCDPLHLTEELLRTALDRLAPHPGARPDQLVVTYPLRPGDASEPVLADRKSTRLNSSHVKISYAVFCL